MNLREFLKSFEDTGIDPEERKLFYRSVKKSIILSYFGKRTLSELFKIEDKCQWPLLQRIADPSLPIYRNADKDLVDEFIKSINDEKTLRADKSRMDRDEYWRALFYIIQGRLEIFKIIFNYCNKDVRRCELVAERYKKSRPRKGDDSKHLWKLGNCTGATALAGVAALRPISRKGQR